MFLRIGEQLISRCGWIFAPLSFFYAAAIFLRNKAYDFRLFPIVRVRPVVVSVGNVVVGGSGKTPFVEALAKKFSHKKVAILSRGYGKIADEAMWLKKRLPQVEVYIGKNRAKLAKNVQADLIILDDGMQHRKLHRDLEVVLGERKGHYLPWGFLRDDPKRKGDFSFQVKLLPKRVVDAAGNEQSIAGKRVGIFCGIAKPQRFRESVQSLGAQICSEVFWGDHERADLSKLQPHLTWICTEKDAIKFKTLPENIWILEMEMQPLAWDKLIAKIEKTIDNRRL